MLCDFRRWEMALEDGLHVLDVQISHLQTFTHDVYTCMMLMTGAQNDHKILREASLHGQE